MPGAGRRLGIAPHSLRAVAPEDLRAVVAALDERDPEAPIHLHIAEQTAEVDASLEATGMRPVEWLAEHAELSPRWCLVHATHVTAGGNRCGRADRRRRRTVPDNGSQSRRRHFPARGVARRGRGDRARVGQPRQRRRDRGGPLLEYGQRLRGRRRVVAESPEALYVDAARFGGRALGQPLGTLAAGSRADFIVLDAASPALCGDVTTLLDRYLVAGRHGALRDVYAGGRRVVESGRHVAREAVAERYRVTLAKVIPALKGG